MKKEQRLALNMARRCQTVAARYLGTLPHDQVPARAVLHDVIVRTERLAAEQQASMVSIRTERTRQKVLTSVLRSKHLLPLVRALRGWPRAMAGDQLRYEYPMGGAALVKAARDVAARAEPRQVDLIATGLTPTFLEDLLGVARAVEECMATRLRLRARATEIRQAMREQQQRGRYALDAIESALRIRYVTTPGVIAEWREARRKAQTPAPAPAPAPASKPANARTSAPELICVR